MLRLPSAFAAVNLAAAGALRFVESQGIVLATAKGPVPRFIDAIAGESILGNWWSHPHANRIYNVLAEVCESEQMLVCRLVNGKVTLVHRRLWPALVRLADGFPTNRLARVCEQHTASGRHSVLEVPFPEWVTPEVAMRANAITDAEAVALLGPWLHLFSPSPTPRNGT